MSLSQRLYSLQNKTVKNNYNSPDVYRTGLLTKGVKKSWVIP